MKSTKSHSVEYGSSTILFALEYCDRKTLGIEVHPDSSVVVKAPHNWRHRAKRDNLYAKAETNMGQAFQDVLSTIIFGEKTMIMLLVLIKFERKIVVSGT